MQQCVYRKFRALREAQCLGRGRVLGEEEVTFVGEQIIPLVPGLERTQQRSLGGGLPKNKEEEKDSPK